MSLREIGKDIGDVDQGMRMFTLRMYQAAQGSGYGADALKKLGYSAKEAKELGLMPIGESLDILINKMNGIENVAQRNTVAVMLFGRSAITFMPLIEEGLKKGPGHGHRIRDPTLEARDRHR